jgi:uncharacterized membrane protein YeaQ/YmgE (transglycosylase-associated protein family)
VLIAFILVLILSGFIGAIARWAVPGPDPMGVLATIALGFAGSLIGGLLSYFLLGRAGGIIFAILGSVVILVLYRKFVQHRPITGPGARQPPA